MVAVTAEAVSAARPRLHTSFAGAAILVVVGIMSTTLGQEQLLGRIPLTNLLKNTLHESRTATSGFFFLAGLAWYFKPLAGILTDASRSSAAAARSTWSARRRWAPSSGSRSASCR